MFLIFSESLHINNSRQPSDDVSTRDERVKFKKFVCDPHINDED